MSVAEIGPRSGVGVATAEIIAAFGVSGSQAAGSLQFLVNGAWNKRYQVGAAAMNGVIAATLARNDFVGATESIEGKHGLLVGYSDNAHPDKAVAGLPLETIGAGGTLAIVNRGATPFDSRAAVTVDAGAGDLDVVVDEAVEALGSIVSRTGASITRAWTVMARSTAQVTTSGATTPVSVQLLTVAVVVRL